MLDGVDPSKPDDLSDGAFRYFQMERENMRRPEDASGESQEKLSGDGEETDDQVD